MLQSIIDYLTIKLQALKIADVYGLGELVVDQDSEKPALYTGSGQYQSLVNFDNHNGLMYFRLVSPVSNAIAESQIGGDEVFQRTYNLRVIAYVNKEVYNTDNNYIDDKIAHNIQLAIDNEDDGLLSTSLGAQTATIQTTSYETNRRNVSDGESLGFDIPFNYVFLALDFNVIIIGSQDCFNTYGCNDTPIDYLDLLRAEICDSECLDGTATATNSLSTVIGSVNVPSGETANIPITDSTITRSDATTIATVPAETNATIPDSPVTLQNTALTVLSTTNVLADSTATITAPDATANAKNSLNNTVGTANVPSGATGNVTVGDSSILRSDLTTIATTPATVSYTVADSPVRVEYVNGSLISNTNVKAASSATIQVPNQATLNDQVNTSTTAQVVTAIELAGKECGVLEGLSDEYGGIGNFATWGATTTPYCVGIENNEFYVVLNGGSVQIFDAATRTLQRTVLGFGTLCRHIRFNATQYLVTAFTTGQVRIMDTATDTQDALITTVAVFSAAFNPNNGNLFWTNGGTIEEKTQLNVAVGATFTSVNVVRQRTIKNEPSTNRMWVGGDNNNSNIGRLSYFDATTRAFTNITFSGTITFAINVLTGLAFDGTYIYVIHQTGGSTAMCMTKIDSTGVVQCQTLILGDDASICGNYYTGYGCPVVVYPISILNTNGIAKAL